MWIIGEEIEICKKNSKSLRRKALIDHLTLASPRGQIEYKNTVTSEDT